MLDRVPKKSKFAEWPAEFSAYSRDKYKNFLLTEFLKNISKCACSSAILALNWH